MKNIVRSVVSLLLVVAIVGLMVPLAPQSAAAIDQQNKQEKQQRVKDIKIQNGPEIAARVKKLKESNKNVRAALRAFEKNGHTPKIDAAVVITGKVESSAVASNRIRKGSMIQQASFFAPQQQATISENGIELIFITTLEMTYEWQGTVIANRYDEYGNLIQQYVADTVLTASEYNPQEWSDRYEVSFENGTPYLMHEPGMYAGFAFGTPIQQHQANFGTPPPLNLESQQFATPEQEQQYYDMYPQQREYDRSPGGDRGPVMEQQISRLSGVKFLRASFQQRSDRAIERNQMRCGNTGCGPTITQVFPGLGGWARDTGIACASFAAGCALTSAIFAGFSAGPCFVAGCASFAIRNAATRIFRIN